MKNPPSYQELEQRILELEQADAARAILMEQLHHSRAWMESILHVSPLGIGVVLNRVFQEVNEGLCRMTGYSREELVGQSSRILYASDQEFERVGREKYEQIRKTGTGTIDTCFQAKDGRLVHVLLSSMIIDSSDPPAASFTALDLTERVLAEQSLRQEQSLYKDLVATQPGGVYRLRVRPGEVWEEETWRTRLDSLYSIDMVSERFSEISGISREEFIANPGSVPDHVHPEDQENFFRLNVAALTELKTFVWEGRFLKHQEVIHVHFESIPRRLDNGDIIWTGVLYDITERKRLEDAREAMIQELRKALSEVKTLSGLLPICSFCKKIRDDNGYWNQLESFLREHSRAQFSHSICQECASKFFPDEDLDP